MLKKHHQLISSFFILLDLSGVLVLWSAAYCFVFEAPWKFWDMMFFHVDRREELWALWPEYRWRLPLGLGMALISFHVAHFYRPRRSESLWQELPDLIKGSFLLCLLLSVYGYWETPPQQQMPLFSRVFVAFMGAGVLLWTSASHVLGRSLLRKLRRRGYNLRYVLIVGAGSLGCQVLDRIQRNRWTGLRAVGFVDEKEKQGSEVQGLKVLGSVNQLNVLIAEHGVDQVYVALPREHQERLHEVMEALSVETVDVKVVPDLTDFVTLRLSVGEFDGLPLISLQETPLIGWNRVLKRVFDFLVGSFCLLVFSLPMIIIAIFVKLTSPGPVFYRQERIGLAGRGVSILKLRSKKMDDENETGANWAKQDDDLRTAIGRFLRSSNLDELPQLFNVLKGEMSLVGPRPERPVFIEEFKKNIPRYMLRHRMKAGMTGWAQVNGWRGNTSLEKRIQCDLYYIENWSLWLDIRIMFMQLFRWKSQNAY
jgi:Undecaprenyl-phosphate glucose phosphotransferase